MTPTRKPPHCKTCHKPLKGHKRGICDTTSADTPTASSPSRTPRSAPTKKSTKSAPHPLEILPTLSPQSTQILNDILRKNSQSAPPIQIPAVRRRSPRLSGKDGADGVESLHVALSHLSANDTEEGRNVSDTTYTPTEVDESEDALDLDQSTSPDPTQIRATSTVASRTTSSFAVSQLIESEESKGSNHLGPQRTGHRALASGSATIQEFLKNMSQSSYHPPATIFSFPKNAIRSLEDGANRLGLFVHVLVLPTKQDDSEWVPVVVGRDSDAIAKLLEDSEKLAQAVRHAAASNSQSGSGLGMSHVVVGTLGVLATWAGLAYT